MQIFQKNIKFIFIFIITLFSNSVIASQVTLPWELKKTEGDFSLYTAIDTQSNNLFTKVEFIIHQPISKVLYVATDISEYPNWFEGVSSVKVLNLTNPHDYTLYLQLHLPFPAKNRHAVTHTTVSFNKSDQQALLIYSTDNSVIEDVDGHMQVGNIDGQWVFKGISKTITRVTYQTQIDPGGYLPAFITNLINTGMTFDTAINFEKHANKEQYTDKEALWLNEIQ